MSMFVHLTLTSEQAYTCAELLSAEIDRLSELDCWSQETAGVIRTLEQMLKHLEAAIAIAEDDTDGQQTVPI